MLQSTLDVRRGLALVALLFAALAAAVAAAVAVPAVAGAVNPTVTVRVEGEAQTFLPPTTVTLGDGTANTPTWNGVGTMPTPCKNNTAYAAIEKATQGNWDRGNWILTMYAETHDWSWPLQDYWIYYDNNDYASVVPCGRTMNTGDTVLMQAGPSGPSPDWVPASVPLEITAPASVISGTAFAVHVDEWVPPTTNPNGAGIVPSSLKQSAVGYVIGRETSVGIPPTTGLVSTNASGNASVTLSTTGWQTIVVYDNSDPNNWGRSAKRICVKATPSSTC